MSFEKIIKRNDYYFCINYADITPSDLSFLKSCWEQQEFSNPEPSIQTGFME